MPTLINILCQYTLSIIQTFFDCLQYYLPYTSLITEVGDDGAVLCGVELELIHLELVTPRHHYFFWSPVEQSLIFAHERSALQAVTFLQCLYSFSLIEYRKGVAPNKYY